MNKKGHIIVIDDDLEDLDCMAEVFEDLHLSARVMFFTCSRKAFAYLKSTSENPFIIISDVVLPHIDGLSLRDMLYEEREEGFKSIPYVFLTTYREEKFIKHAASVSKFGYFIKPESYDKVKAMIKRILDYWSHVVWPSTQK